ncbi:uncharacterized protein LOC118418249 [Branchiostoma floridae]|uniref:Uncharacterized protein LOC118418249 n=1 Tax=Branchiostoma floridae TaxID=7739 RepID=A0A9J7LBV8_BRAFL|nr:uncharacterized protein LOC118418249 [Branchiostoma floridae]
MDISDPVPGKKDVATQTGEDNSIGGQSNPVKAHKSQTVQQSNPNQPLLHSTPVKASHLMDLDMSFTPSSTCSTPVKKRDLSYRPGSESESESECELVDEECLLEGRRFIVFGEQLKELFQKCPSCGGQTLLDTKTRGCAVSITYTCENNHTGTWQSQPYDKGRARGNLLIPSAILFTGGSVSKFIDFADCLQLQFFSEQHFHSIQRTFAIPVVNEHYLSQQNMALDLCRGAPIDIIGDGRCDSPGHNAKYMSYTLMEETTGLILAMELIQVTETGTSQAMEKEGLDRCLAFLTDPEGEDMEVQCLTTDRHRGAGALMRKVYKEIEHQFDIFHVCKNVKKKIFDKAKGRNCAELLQWLKSICNHLWWAVQTCEGNAENDKYKHTGEVEVYHNVVTKYAPKRIHYSYNGMKARVQLSIIDHNENIGRKQAKTLKGDTMTRLDWSKKQKRYAVKNVYEQKDYSFRQKLMADVLERAQNGEKTPIPRRPDLPKNIAPEPRPDKAQALAAHRSRFPDRGGRT